jgi:aldehyde dehydrogenase (NAD+)
MTRQVTVKVDMCSGGKQSGTEGYFVEPTVFSNVEDHFEIATQEIFGPVQSILKFSTLDEVILRANATNYGLGAYLYAKDINVITRLAHSIKVLLPPFCIFPLSRFCIH